MKYKFEIEGDWYEDRGMLKEIIEAQEAYMIVDSVYNAIRSRLKHTEGLTDSEEAFLEQIKGDLSEAMVAE